MQIGDDVHMRTQGTTNLLIRNLLPQLAAPSGAGRVALARFLSGNHLFFLNLAMAAAKSVAMWAEQVEGSSIVTMMCRNGTSYGIRLAGSAEVFLADAPPVGDAMYYPDYGPETSAPDIGDSAILELIGLGGAAAAGSPAVAGFLRGGHGRGRRHDRGHGGDLRRREHPVQVADLGTTGERRSAWTCVAWSSSVYLPGSPPGSCMRAPASARSVPGWRPPRSSASKPRCLLWPRDNPVLRELT